MYYLCVMMCICCILIKITYLLIYLLTYLLTYLRFYWVSTGCWWMMLQASKQKMRDTPVRKASMRMAWVDEFLLFHQYLTHCHQLSIDWALWLVPVHQVVQSKYSGCCGRQTAYLLDVATVIVTRNNEFSAECWCILKALTANIHYRCSVIYWHRCWLHLLIHN